MEELLKKLREKDIQVRLDGTELEIHFDGDSFPEDLLMELKRHKSDLIEFLSLRQSKPTAAEIPVQERPEQIPLSFNQERLWFIDKLVGSTNYHLFSVLRILGNLDEDTLRQAFRGVVDRHEILRTVYLEEGGKAYQRVMTEGQWDFDFIKKAADDDELDLPTLVSTTSERPFDLTKDYMLRVGLLALSDKEHVLILLMHHIASDGWSIPVFLKEFATLYEEKRAGKKNTSLAPLPIQYADYALWTRAHFQQEVMKEKLAYWTTKLSGVATLELKTDFPRSSRQSIHGSSLSFFIDPTLSKATAELASQEGTTLYMLLLAVFKVLLFKYTGQEDICVGTAIANRERKETEALIGYFVNTIALRSSVQGELPFADFLKQVKETVLSGFEHQDIPFEKVVDKVVSKRDLSRNPIFQVMFAHQNYKSESKLHIEGLEIVPEPMDRIFTKFDLSFNVIETTEGLALEIEYCSDLFTPDTIHRLFAHYQNILHAVVADKNLPLAKLPISDAKEFEKIRRFNDTTVAYPTDKTILDLFDEQVEKSPDNIALVFGDQQLTYRELEERSNQVAHLLQNPKRNANDLVGICLDRSLEMVVGLLGILKSGKAYVPIDPNYPEDRINYLVEDASLEVLLTDTLNATKLAAIGKTILLLDQIEASTSKEPLKAIRPDQLAYVIYTSGTTGKPKGVKNTHAALWNRLLWAQDYFDLQSGQDVVLQKTTFCFDVSVWEFFWPLMTGVKLVLAQPDGHKDSSYLATLIEKERITTIHFVPSMLEAFLLDTPALACPSLKRVLCSGEALKPQQVHKFKEVFGDRVLLYNLYGPTEAAIDVTCWQVPLSSPDPIEKIPIGKPVSNTSIYILDEFDNPCGIGMVGELCIGGQQVSQGYWNREKLTQEKFTADPFAREPGKKMYRSGDLACWLPDGNIEYIGRKDTQVKIRGHRIELGEIEFCLSTHPQVQQVVVATKDRGNDKVLVAFVVANEATLDKEALRNHLKKELPDYMLPAHFVRLEALPLTANGKIDRRALPEVEEADIQKQSYVGPRNEAEEAFVKVWKEVLGLKQIGIYDNFFELGGDSIIVIQIVSRLKMLGYQLQPLDLFENQTIASLTQGLVKTKQQVLGEQGYLDGEVGLLPIQQHFFEKDFADRSHFNQSILLEVTKEVSRSHLEQIIVQLLEYHDALRLEYQEQNQDWIQSYGKAQGQLLLEDLTAVAKKDLAAAITKTAEKYQKSLSIEKGIVSTFVYMETPDYEAKARFLMIHHHLVIDGISWRILVSQIENGLHLLAEGKDLTLSPKGSSFRQWSEHLKELAQREALLEELPYWKNIKNKYQPLPVDVDVERITKADIVSHAVELDAAFSTDLLKNVNQTYQTNINDVLLAALAMTLCEYTERNHLTIGLESHGRDHQSDRLDITNTVGWFTDLYPVALSIEKKADVTPILKSIKEQLRLIPNKGMGYGLLKYLHPSSEVRAALAGKTWDVLFNYLGQIGGLLGAESQWFAVADEEMGATIAPTYPIDNQLEINCFIADGVLKIFWNYSATAFQENTIAVLAQSYLENLRKIIVHCQTALPEKTPSDFGLAGVLSLEELDRFFEIHDREKIVALYPLSPLQEGILFHKLYDKDSNSYLEQLIVDFAGDLNPTLVHAAWEELAKRHSILRTSIIYDQWSIPLQCVHQSISVPFEIIKDKKSGPTPDLFLQQFLKSDQQRGFDFEQAPLFRITLLQVTGGYKMVFSFHHIIMDGWSLPVLMEAFMRLYEQLLAGHQLAAVSEDRYKDYIDYIQQKDPIAEKTFWDNYLKDFSSPTLLPFLEHSADRNKGLGGFSSMELLFEEKTTSRIKAYAQKNHLTVNTIIQGVWAFLLSQYTNTTDVVYGVTVSGRPADLNHSEKRIGLYINTIPFRAKLERTANVIDWLSQLQLSHSAARDFQYSSLGLIKDLTGIRQDLFDSILVFENYPIKEVLAKESSLKVNAVELKEETNYLLTLIVLLGEKLEIRFKYNQLLKEAHVARIKSHFKQLVEEVVLHEKTALSKLEILTVAEKTAISYPLAKAPEVKKDIETIINFFQKQVLRHPDEEALLFGNKKLTYWELDQRSNKLAHYLKGQFDLKKGDRVGIKLERSEYLVISILATLKLGAVYVPIDLNYPDARIKHITEDSDCKIILNQERIADFLEREETYPSEMPVEQSIDSEDLAYIIYTSGSTGNPKGVMISHGNVAHFLSWSIKEFEQVNFDVLYAVTSHCFDLSVFEMFYPLSVGKKIRLIRSGIAIDEYILSDANVFLNTVPSALDALLDKGVSLQNVIAINLAGEIIPLKLVNQLSKYPHIAIRNLYGPSEDTTYSSCYKIEFKDQKTAFPIPIGKAIDDTQIYVLDQNDGLSPLGVIGEICIAGHGVAKGYLNRPDLTAQKFVNNPYVSGGIMYRTGDLGKWLLDGNIEFVGRKDDQVKVRGFRIELGEVNNAVEIHPDVNQAITLVKQDKFKSDYLTCYVVAKESFDKTKLKDYLRMTLPDYMIPTSIIRLSKFPLTPNGKVNKKALLNLSEEESDTKAKDAPRSRTERDLLEIWKEFLTINTLGVYDSFFDVGGHSLLAIRILARINKHFKTKLEITDLFQYVHIRALATFIDEQINQEEKEIASPVERKRRKDIPGGAIAVVGMSCRLPKSKTVEAFWENLKKGEDCISDLTVTDLTASGIPEKEYSLPNYVKRRGFIEDIDLFDADFFGIPPAEAAVMDPQSRIFLECCYEAISNAGYNSFDYEGLIGLFAGCGFNQYFLRNIAANEAVLERVGAYTIGLLSNNDFLTSRVAYKLNLKGPVSTVQTACSTSLVSVHHACQSLLNGECDMSLAGGVTLAVPNKRGYLFEEGMIGSSDGFCRAFDEKADGTVGSDGCVVVLLKMLDRAQEDGDQVYAVIKQTAINNDGDNKAGFTAPTIEGQRKVIEEALEKAGVAPTELSYIETHGTGTKLGDPIEFSALQQVFEKHTTAKQFCAIGSVKTNIGHTDTAAGAAGLLKTVLSLYHRQLLPSLHYTRPNSYIDLGNSPFYVNTELKDWTSENGNLKAGVSSFGIGGVNAHVILESAPAPTNYPDDSTCYLLPLSAKNEISLQQMQEDLRIHLENNPNQALADIAYTLQVGRKAYGHRKAFVAQNRSQFYELLSQENINTTAAIFENIEDTDVNINVLERKINKALLDHRQALEAKNYWACNAALKYIVEEYQIPLSLPAIQTNAEEIFNVYLQQLWESGININWNPLYAKNTRQRLLLPIYPLQKKRHWLIPADLENKKTTQHDFPTETNKEPIYYKPNWKKSSFEISSIGAGAKEKQTYLVFENHLDLSQSFIQHLTLEGHKLIKVNSGNAFKQKDTLEYVIDPKESDDYKKLLDQLLKDHDFPDKIIHLWTLDADVELDSLTGAKIDHFQNLGFYSLLFLTKAITRHKGEKTQDLIIISNHLQAVFDGELVNPAKAMLLALAKVAPQEYDHFRCKSIDVNLPGNAEQTATLINQLLVELDFASNNPILALRDQFKWVPSYEPLQLERKETVTGFKNGGVYLITGGLGGIGLALARHIAQKVNAKIILVGRSAFPDKDSWKDWEEKPEAEKKLTEKIKQLKAIEAHGSELLLMTGDVADESQMKDVFETIKKRFSKIDGLIHAAGIPDENLIVGQTREKIEAVIKSKVKGTIVLNNCITSELDFFVCCSSISSIYGLGGQLGYIAANTFLDAFSHSGMAKTPVKSINWDAWNEVGMAVQNGLISLDRGLSSDEGLEIFERVLQSPVSQVLVSKTPLEEQKNKFLNRKKEFLAQLDTNGIEEDKASILPQRMDKKEIQEKLKNVWKAHLGFEEIGLEEDFFEIGGDSLLATKVIASIRKELGLEVSIDDMFDYGTIAELSEQMFSEQKAVILPEVSKMERPPKIPLSYNQERLWFLDQLEGSISYHIPIVLEFEKGIQIDLLEASFREILERHESLRTVYKEVSGKVYQEQTSVDNWSLSSFELASLDVPVATFIDQEIHRPFDLSTDVMLRGSLIKGKEQFILILVMHHIASDGWSMPILVDELTAIYHSKKKGIPSGLAPLPIQYVDYALWQQTYLQGDFLAEKLAYWKQQLSGLSPLDLPTDFPRPPQSSGKGALAHFEIGKELKDALTELSRREGLTMYMLLLSVFQLLLYRYSGQTDISVGSPIANRQDSALTPLIGYFVNTLVLRSDFSKIITFKELLDQVKETTLAAYAHQEAPFEKVVEQVWEYRDRSRSPLFQVMFALQNNKAIAQIALDDVVVNVRGYEHKTAKFDLSVELFELEKSLYLTVEYSTDLFDHSTIEQLLRHYKQLLSSVVANPSQNLDNIALLPAAEERQLLQEFNNTLVKYPQEQTIVSLFSEQVKKTPDAIALVFEEHSMTYRELDERSNQLAHYLLKNYNVKADDLICVKLARSEAMIIALLGVLKSGAAYVPIDPSFPQERIAFMIADSNCRVCIDEEGYEQFVMASAKLSKEVISYDIRPHHLAYVIYTSGTTGQPKGVMIEHGSLSNLINWFVHRFDISQSSIAIQLTDFTFDPSLEDIFGTLAKGGTYHIIRRELLLDIQKLREYLIDKKITILNYVPQYLFELLAGQPKIRSIKTVIAGGERMSEKVKNGICTAGYELYNNYGPTEITVDALSGKMNDQALTIGRPIANCQALVLDEKNQLVPIGVSGELCISGAGLARGYLNDPELTREKFIAHPFKENTFLYKTGDVVKWLSDGSIAYIGRKDHQVKIRGYRIELEEVELAILSVKADLSQVVVAVKERAHEKVLVAYFTGIQKTEKEAIWKELRRKLPEYMIPTYFVWLDAFPLTSNGKVDRTALPDIEETDIVKKEYIGPRNEEEEKLVAIWQDLLGLNQVGIEDNFFEIGGDSFLTIKVLALIKERLNVKLEIVDLFQYTNIEELAAYIKTKLNHESATTESDRSIMIEEQLKDKRRKRKIKNRK